MLARLTAVPNRFRALRRFGVVGTAIRQRARARLSAAVAATVSALHRRHLHLAEPRADLCGEAGIGGDRRELRGLLLAERGRRYRRPARRWWRSRRRPAASCPASDRPARARRARGRCRCSRRAAPCDRRTRSRCRHSARRCCDGAVDDAAVKHLGGLAGQKAWHICAGEALPRISGKYLPSQLRTQKAGPEPPAAPSCGGGAAAAGLMAKGSAKKFACCGTSRCGCCCWAPPKKKSNRPSADTAAGHASSGACKGGGNKHRAAPQARRDSQLCTQRLLHPTLRTGSGPSQVSAHDSP